MSYQIYLTETWPYERIKRYSGDLTEAMKKIARRFPDDISFQTMAEEIASGERQLWIIVDEKENFVAFVTSHIEILASGKKRVELLELAGYGGEKIADMIEPIEEWAKTIGASEICPIGRIGWSKIMRAHGYRPSVVKYRKELNNGRK